jgi:hypothetical protein
MIYTVSPLEIKYSAVLQLCDYCVVKSNFVLTMLNVGIYDIDIVTSRKVL